MDKNTEMLKVTISGIITAIISILGSNYKLVILLLVFMAADTLFGHLRAIKDSKWTSNNARWGMIGKLVELILIALMYVCEWTFGIDWLVNIIVLYFILCEGASIIENVIRGNLNQNVPKELLDILLKAKQNAVTTITKEIKHIFGGDDNDDTGNASDTE